MRPFNLRCSRTAQLTAGALALAAPATAVALVASQADAQGPVAGQADAQGSGHAAGQGTLEIVWSTSHLRYGHRLTVRGFAPASDAGHRVALQFATTSHAAWHTIAHARVHSNGAFRLRTLRSLVRSGEVRVVPGWDPAPASTGPANFEPLPTASPAPTPNAISAAGAGILLAPSSTEPVIVVARLAVSKREVVALPGQTLSLHGRLLPRRGGAVVRLQARSNNRWQTIARARTGRHGGFVVRHRFDGWVPGTVRVRFTGDRVNAAVSSRAVAVSSLRPYVASWYNDGGNTACGFHAGYGVASPYLPCGTKVTFAYHGRSVTATVDDRGPFISGRSFDLNQTTAGALGFGGVDTVWASV